MEPTNLQQWANDNEQRDGLLWKGAWGDQIMFVRDHLGSLLGAGLIYWEQKKLVKVISTHRSKSCVLPVYSIERPDLGVRFVLRNNFYNWKLSVISEKPIDADFSGLFHTTPPVDPSYTGDHLHPVYFEGFPEELIFGYYAQNKQEWSAEIHGNTLLWTVLFLIMRSLGVVKALEWHTPESHRAEMDAERKREEAYRAAHPEEFT